MFPLGYNIIHQNRNLRTVVLSLLFNLSIFVCFSNCALRECPQRLGFVGAQLTYLNLSDNSLRVLPPEIGCLRGLQKLSLKNNQLQDLPVSAIFWGSIFSLDDLTVCMLGTFSCFCCCLLTFFKIKYSLRNKSDCQRVWIQIRTDVLSILIWVQNFCKDYQHMTKVAARRKRVKHASFGQVVMAVSLRQFLPC